MRRVSISYGFSKLWCVCSFLRSFVRSFVRLQCVCLFVCLFVFVRFEKCRRHTKKGRKAPPRPFNCKIKKACGEETVVLLFFGRSRSLGCVERARTFGLLSRSTRSWRGTRGTRRDTPSKNSRRYDPCLFVALSFGRRWFSSSKSSSFCVETTHHPSIDRPLSSRVIGHRARAGVTTLQSRAARRTETRGGRRSRRSHALK